MRLGRRKVVQDDFAAQSPDVERARSERQGRDGFGLVRRALTRRPSRRIGQECGEAVFNLERDDELERPACVSREVSKSTMRETPARSREREIETDLFRCPDLRRAARARSVRPHAPSPRAVQLRSAFMKYGSAIGTRAMFARAGRTRLQATAEMACVAVPVLPTARALPLTSQRRSTLPLQVAMSPVVSLYTVQGGCQLAGGGLKARETKSPMLTIATAETASSLSKCRSAY